MRKIILIAFLPIALIADDTKPPAPAPAPTPAPASPPTAPAPIIPLAIQKQLWHLNWARQEIVGQMQAMCGAQFELAMTNQMDPDSDYYCRTKTQPPARPNAQPKFPSATTQPPAPEKPK